MKNQKVARILARHGAALVESPAGQMLVHMRPWSTKAADKIYNELRDEARVSKMVTIICEPAPQDSEDEE